MEGKVFIVSVRRGDAEVWVGSGKVMKSVYAAAKLHGRIAEPSIRYRTMVRRLNETGSTRIWDRIRFESEEEARFSPLGSHVTIRSAELIK